MKKIKFSSILVVLIWSTFLHSVFAASYSYKVSEDQYTKEVKVTINVDPEGSQLNAYEGQISFDKGALNLVRIETDNSVANAWPTFPEAGNSPVGDDTIYFEGISQSAFSGVIEQGSNVLMSGKLLTLVFSVKKEGETEVNLSGARMYLSDGDATEVPVHDSVIPLTLKKSFLKSSYFIPTIVGVESPLGASEDVYGIVTVSDDVYDGKKFVAFENRNKQKSLAFFQIAESSSKDPASVSDYVWVIAKSPYLLTKTNIAPFVHIKAVYTDGSYSYKTVEAVENTSSGGALSYILGIIIFLILVIHYASPFKQKNL